MHVPPKTQFRQRHVMPVYGPRAPARDKRSADPKRRNHTAPCEQSKPYTRGCKPRTASGAMCVHTFRSRPRRVSGPTVLLSREWNRLGGLMIACPIHLGRRGVSVKGELSQSCPSWIERKVASVLTYRIGPYASPCNWSHQKSGTGPTPT